MNTEELRSGLERGENPRRRWGCAAIEHRSDSLALLEEAARAVPADTCADIALRLAEEYIAAKGSPQMREIRDGVYAKARRAGCERHLRAILDSYVDSILAACVHGDK